MVWSVAGSEVICVVLGAVERRFRSVARYLPPWLPVTARLRQLMRGSRADTQLPGRDTDGSVVLLQGFDNGSGFYAHKHLLVVYCGGVQYVVSLYAFFDDRQLL